MMLANIAILLGFTVAIATASSASTLSMFYLGPDSSETIKGTPIVTSQMRIEQVADIVTRLNGLPPLLKEETLNLPHLSILLGKHTPLIIELDDAEIPNEAVHILKYTSLLESLEVPTLKDVLSVLQSHGIVAEGKSVNNKEIKDLVGSNRPIIILQREGARSVQRRLTNVVIQPLTEFQINNYQITLWTGVVFFLLLLSAVCMVVQMEVIPDSLLFAKFQSSRTGARSD